MVLLCKLSFCILTLKKKNWSRSFQGQIVLWNSLFQHIMTNQSYYHRNIKKKRSYVHRIILMILEMLLNHLKHQASISTELSESLIAFYGNRVDLSPPYTIGFMAVGPCRIKLINNIPHPIFPLHSTFAPPPPSFQDLNFTWPFDLLTW